MQEDKISASLLFHMLSDIIALIYQRVYLCII